jgi:hypothetical protein
MAAFSFYMMYKKLAYFVVIIFLAGDLSGQELKPNHIQVAILGMFHMGESSDYRKAEMDSPLTGKRQREIAEVVNKLAAFRPDKIFVENTPDTQEFWNQVFEQYKKGRLPAESSVLVNEIFQIGIKTAALNPRSKGVICINYDFRDSRKESLPSWNQFEDEIIGKRPSYDDLLQQNLLTKRVFEKFIADHEAWKSLTIREHLIKMNEESSLRKLQYFNTQAWMDNNSEKLGAEFSTREYYRNLKILQTLYQRLEASDKRILIIYGAAHAKIFRDVMESHPVFEMADITKILK